MIRVVGSAMDLAMENSRCDPHELSGYSSGSRETIEDVVEGLNWSTICSPMADWETFSASQDDDFENFMESIFNEDRVYPPSSRNCNSSCSTTEMTLAEDQEETAINGGGEEVKRLRLVHLLIAAAEAVAGAKERRDLARVILVRLKQLVSLSDGTTMERLAAYFTEALYALLEGTRPRSGSNSRSHNRFITRGPHVHDFNPTDAIIAFQLLQDMSPYVKFAHFTANQAILEALGDDLRVHIVDYDIMEGIQWASLMQALESRKDGTPAPHLRITALSRSGTARSSIGTVQETGRRLIAFAAAIGLPFSFHQCRLDSDEKFRKSVLKIVKGEALFVNCMLHLPHFHHRPPESVVSFLSGCKTLNPRLVTLVEEELGGTDGTFMSRFMDSLHHYCAIYDSLEADFPMNHPARALVERVFMGPRITGRLRRIYRAGEDEEHASWGDWLGSSGFRSERISFGNHCQARLLVGLFNEGYRVENSSENRLVLGWKSRRLLSASVWTSSPSRVST